MGPEQAVVRGMQMSADEQVVYGGYDSGVVHMWDLRAGKAKFGKMNTVRTLNFILRLSNPSKKANLCANFAADAEMLKTVVFWCSATCALV